MLLTCKTSEDALMDLKKELEKQHNVNCVTFVGDMGNPDFVATIFDDVTRTGSYSGDLVKGLADGEGIFTTRNSDNELYTYTGQWKNGMWNGQGLWEFPEIEDYTYEGTFTNCEYTPNLAEFFRFFGTRPEHEYTMSHKAWKTLSLYPEVFLENNAAGSVLPVDYYFNYDAFAKNPNNYGDSLISVYGLRVVQIFE